MNILFIYSDEITMNDMLWGVCEVGLEPDVYPGSVKILEYSETEKASLQAYMQQREYDVVMTYNFCMTVAAVCKELQIKYISWVYDSPQGALYTDIAKSEYNYIFVFDKAQYGRMKKEGLVHLYYLPLAANVTRTSGLLITEEDERKYSNDIAFVGNLYKKNGYNKYELEFTEEIREKIDRIIQKIALHWGKGYECFDVLDYNFTDHISDKLHLYTDANLHIDRRYMMELYLLSRKISEIDRIGILKALAVNHDVTLYTNSDTSDLQNDLQNVNIKGKITYIEEMPKVFYLSKINLNITMRSIETGIPQRIFDIMSVGGFVLSNYQVELTELFEPDQEIVLFHDVNELIEKVDYYLAHEEERIRIAMNGYKKVRDTYNTVNAVKKMLEETEKENIDPKTYVVVYREAALEKEMALAQKIRETVDRNENKVYFIGIGEEDTYEDCIDSFYSFCPDIIITVNFAGFTLVKEDGELLYSAFNCDCIHVLTGSPWSYGYNITKCMNLNAMLVVGDAVSRDYIEKYCENIPKVLYRSELKDYIDEDAKVIVEKGLDNQQEIYQGISKELTEAYQKNGQPFERLLEEYLKKHQISVSDDEFVNLLIQMKDVGRYIDALDRIKKENPLISVVIPTYNREKVLRNAMESVLNQSYSNLELIIADDCSEDQTQALVRNMMQADSRIRYIQSEKNLGAGGARNLGASIAKGEYIAFNDSDAVWQKDKLKKQFSVFKKHEKENPGMVFHAFMLSDKNKNEIYKPFENLPEDFEKKHIMQHLLRDPLADTSTMMLTMKVWRESGGFNEKLRSLEDYEFSLRIAEKYNVYYFHEPLITTYFSAGSVNQNWKEGIKTYFYVLKEFIEWYRANEFSKWQMIFRMWGLCGRVGESEFFEEQFRLYAKATGEDLKWLGQQMQQFIKEHTTSDQEWNII